MYNNTFIFSYIIMVEAIRYEHMPLYNEKSLVINTAIMEITETISHQDEKLDVLEQYTSQYMQDIRHYESGKINFTSLLQKLQPLQAIPNPDYNKNIDEFNTIVSIINSLNYSPHHEQILRKQCLRIQELLDPEQMPLLVEKLECWS